jgi:hypothetical protein
MCVGPMVSAAELQGTFHLRQSYLTSSCANIYYTIPFNVPVVPL